MAIKFAAEDGSYEKSVPDSGDGQSKAKFGTPIVKPKMSSKEPQQSIEKPKEATSKAHSIP